MYGMILQVTGVNILKYCVCLVVESSEVMDRRLASNRHSRLFLTYNGNQKCLDIDNNVRLTCNKSNLLRLLAIGQRGEINELQGI